MRPAHILVKLIGGKKDKMFRFLNIAYTFLSRYNKTATGLNRYINVLLPGEVFLKVPEESGGKHTKYLILQVNEYWCDHVEYNFCGVF